MDEKALWAIQQRHNALVRATSEAKPDWNRVVELTNASAADVSVLADELTELRKRHDRLQVQLAGCGVAALGDKTVQGLKQGDYGYSASFEDVMELRRRFEVLVSGDSYHAWLLTKKLEQEAGTGSEYTRLEHALERAEVYLRAHDCFDQECGTCQVLKEISKALGRGR